MNEMTIKNRIEDAVGIQSAPEKLVKQTVLRVQGIVAGRSAEQRLEQEGERLPKEEVAYLTAAGLIGRLAISGPLPEGSSLQQMTEQLAASPKLNQRLNRPVEETLSRLRRNAFKRTGCTSSGAGKTARREANGNGAARDVIRTTAFAECGNHMVLP